MQISKRIKSQRLGILLSSTVLIAFSYLTLGVCDVLGTLATVHCVRAHGKVPCYLTSTLAPNMIPRDSLTQVFDQRHF